MPDEIAQPAPPIGLGAVDGVADPGGPKPEQRFGGFAVVVRDKRDGWNSGELAHEPRYPRQGLAMAAMHGDDEGVNAAAPGDVERFPQRVGVQSVEASNPRSIEAWPLRRRKDRAHGNHAPRW